MTDQLPEIFYQDDQLSTSPEHRSCSPGEQRLWQKKIIVYLSDAVGKSPDISRKVKRQDTQERAINWFLKNGKDFQDTCHAAGFEPEWVRDNAMGLLRDMGLIP